MMKTISFSKTTLGQDMSNPDSGETAEVSGFNQTARGKLLNEPEPETGASAVGFAQTPRGALAASAASEADPVTFYNVNGGTYEATDPGEINRLTMSRDHFLNSQDARPENAFDPADHTVAEVLDHVETHVGVDGKRVLDAERAGKARVGILGE